MQTVNAGTPGLQLTLNEFQQAVVDRHLATTNHAIIQSPTGSGKSHLTKLWIASVLSSGRKVIYLVPIRALAQELHARLAVDFPDYKVGAFTGDTRAGEQPPFAATQLLIMTPEKLDACTRSWRTHFAWISDVDLVVVDEFHTLGDRQRGSRLEGSILRLKRLNPFARIVGLSATLGNLEELGRWLGGDAFRSEWRPIPLTWQIRRFKKPGDKPNLLLNEVDLTLKEGGQCIVFVQSRRRAEALSKLLADHLIIARHHHAGLLRADRTAVEDGFRNGTISVIVATTTLAMGLNLPARKVILYDLNRYNGRSNEPIDVITAWQLAGRAGRLGLDQRGEAVLFASSQAADVERYLTGNFEAIQSSLSDVRNLAEQVLAEVASGLSRTEPQLERTFACSLAASQHNLPDIGKTVLEMLNAGMLAYKEPTVGEGGEESEPKASVLRATRLGYIASRHFLFPSTVLLFNRLAVLGDEMTFFDILLAAACSDDCDIVLPASFEDLDQLARRLENEPSHILSLPKHQILDLLNASGGRLLNGVKTALAARAWTRLADVDRVAEEFDCYPFEIFKLSETFERLLPAMAAVVDPRDSGDQDIEEFDQDFGVPLKERIQAATRMIHYGLDEYAATLALIEGVGSTFAMRLKMAGVGDIEDLALCEPGDLKDIEHLSAERAGKWIAEAEVKIKRFSARRYVETGKGHKATAEMQWPVSIDPYRLRRAVDLRISLAAGEYAVEGGSELRHVANASGKWICSCPDFIRGNQCKHILAVRQHIGDPEIVSLWDAVTSCDRHHFSLFELWFDPGKTVTARSEQYAYRRPSQTEIRSAASHVSEFLVGGPQTLEQVSEGFRSSPVLTPLADRINDAVCYLASLQIIVREESTLALTPWGLAVKENGMPFHIAGGIRQLFSDLMTVDPSFSLIDHWTPFDTLTLLELLNDSSPSLRMFSQDLFDLTNRFAEFLAPRSVLWSWIQGDKDASKAEELMGSLSLEPEGKKGDKAEWARKTAYQSTFNAAVMAKLLMNIAEAEISAEWKTKNLETVSSGWRYSTAWLARGLARLIASSSFLMDAPSFDAQLARERLNNLSERTAPLIEALKSRPDDNE